MRRAIAAVVAWCKGGPIGETDAEFSAAVKAAIRGFSVPLWWVLWALWLCWCALAAFCMGVLGWLMGGMLLRIGGILMRALS